MMKALIQAGRRAGVGLRHKNNVLEDEMGYKSKGNFSVKFCMKSEECASKCLVNCSVCKMYDLYTEKCRMKITVEFLESIGACENERIRFFLQFPYGLEVTRENIKAVIEEGYSVSWLIGNSVFFCQEYISLGGDIEVKDSEGFTALHWAALYEREEIVCLLIKAGANIEAKTAVDRTPLMHAVQNGSKMAMLRLIEAGAKLFGQKEVMHSLRKSLARIDE